MDGKVGLIVGQRGTGKTTKVKQIIKPVHKDALLLHDVGGQYKDIYNKPLLDFDKFTNLCTKMSNGVFVFEEATIFLRHTPAKDVVDFLVKSRYRQNTVLFVFHSLRSVPRYIYDLSDFIILFKTKDNTAIVKERFDSEELIGIFEQVNNSPNKHECKFYVTK